MAKYDCGSGYTCQPVALLCAGDLDLVDVCCVVVRDEVVIADHGAVFVADRVQVWSLTQFYYVDFSQSVKVSKCVF